MTSDFRALRTDPFRLLVEYERALIAAHADTALDAPQTQNWVGLGFRLGDTWLLAPRDDVREVIPTPSLTRIPNAQPWVLGLANVRGELLAVVDLQQWLGLSPAAAPTRAQRILIFNSKRMPVGVLVDEVVGYRQFGPADQANNRVSDVPALAPWLLGAFVREAQLWLVFSLQRMAADVAFRSAAR